MKKLLLSISILSILNVFAQTTRVSASDGDFLNPLNWNPIGIPASGDQLTINHDMIMTTGIYYTAGTITISSLGSLMEDATDRDFWVDGTGSLINHGEFKSHLFLASPHTTVHNFGTFSSIDSVWSQTDLINIGVMEVYDFLNDEMAVLTNEGQLIIENDMNNQGLINNKPWASIDLGHDFSNCNLQTLDALFENGGVFCVGNNFSNCFGDTLRGIGHYYIGGGSSNFGVLEGTATFHTPTGTLGITGTVGSGVTITTGGCNLNAEELKLNDLNIYPNPAKTELFVSKEGAYEIFDLEGRNVLSANSTFGRIDLRTLKSGVYLIRIQERVDRFVKH